MFPLYSGISYTVQSILNNVRITPPPSWLPQVSLSGRCKLYGTASRTTLIQTFDNPSKTSPIPTATYTFPLYESSAVVGFRYTIGRTTFEGIVKAKEAAKAQYDEAVARGETAGLLEQRTPDVFSAALGNIPPGARVVVQVDYIMELKHDAQVDGLRFTIPMSIAPTYGETPGGSGAQQQTSLDAEGIDISIQVSMPSIIHSIQSPSHPISLHLGAHSEGTVDDSNFNPKYALVSLVQKSTELDADFVLFIKCTDLATPRALLEAHSTLLKSNALMVTLVPKFNLPPAPMPEIVLLVDRSRVVRASMNTLNVVLVAFLKSLPFGLKFNICSHGPDPLFLWNESRSKSVESLECAQDHVANMKVGSVNSDILPSIRAIASKRCKDLMLEVVHFSGGYIHDSKYALQAIRDLTSHGDVRFFCMGIGRRATHSQMEGAARAGKGFAQIITDEKQKVDEKISRMILAGLSAHIKDYRLEWDGRPTEEECKQAIEAATTSMPSISQDKVAKKISLFDPNADLNSLNLPIVSTTSSDSQLPEASLPCVLQAPYELAPLFPFSRSTVYVIITGDISAPSSVWIRGTTPSGDELELEIEVEPLSRKGSTLHQLAARKILQELEEDTGFFNMRKSGVDNEESSSILAERIAHEGRRVGFLYGVASKWSSFVAVERSRGTASDAGQANNMDSLSHANEPLQSVVSEGASDDAEQTTPSVTMFKNIQHLVFNNSTVNFINHGDQHNTTLNRLRRDRSMDMISLRSIGRSALASISGVSQPGSRLSFKPVAPDLLSRAILDSIPVIHKEHSGVIIAGTLEALVENLIADIADGSTISMSGSESYRQIFLTTYFAYMTTDWLLGVLSRKFRSALQSYDDERAKKIISVLRYWVTAPEVRIDTETLQQLSVFATTTSKDTISSKYAIDLIIEINRTREAQTDTQASPALTPISKLSLSESGPLLMATALTTLECRKYDQLIAADYIRCALHPSELNPVTSMLMFSKRTEYWVTDIILNHDGVSMRRRFFEYFAEIAVKCYEFCNYSSAAAIIQALQSHYITRLPETSMTTLRRLSPRLTALMQEVKYKAIEAKGSCIPRIDVLLSDLLRILDQESAIIQIDGRPLINFRRCEKLVHCSRKQPYRNVEYEESLMKNPGPTQWLENRLLAIDLSDDAESVFMQRSRDIEKEEKARLRKSIGF